MSDLLYDEPPLMIPPTLAITIGLKEALVLQQLFWLGKYRSERERWIKKTLKEWQAAFPFFSEKDCQRIFDRLKERGLVEVKQPGRTDRTKHYRVHLKGVRALPDASGQVDQMELVNFPGLATGQSDQMSNGKETEQQDTAAERAPALVEKIRELQAVFAEFGPDGCTLDDITAANALARFPKADHRQIAHGCAEYLRTHAERDTGLTFHRYLEEDARRNGRTAARRTSATRPGRVDVDTRHTELMARAAQLEAEGR